MEGQYDEFAEFGYNRDCKKGKKQIVIGLLTDENGHPVAVRVFDGNIKNTNRFSWENTDLAHKIQNLS